jgi:hypothetical protein
VSSLDHEGTEKEAGIDKGICGTPVFFIYLTNLSTPVHRISCTGTKIGPEGGVDSVARKGQEGYDRV